MSPNKPRNEIYQLLNGVVGIVTKTKLRSDIVGRGFILVAPWMACGPQGRLQHQTLLHVALVIAKSWENIKGGK
jgi:hypothetical protein